MHKLMPMPFLVDNEPVRVRVWFGTHPVATYVAEASEAERYAAAMRQRFAGLRVTIDDQPSRFDLLLPERVWWGPAAAAG